MKRLLGAVVLTLVLAGIAFAAAPPMPDLANDYEAAEGFPVGPCPEVIIVNFDVAGEPTASDEYYPVRAWFLARGENQESPFVVLLIDREDGRIRAFWIDYNRDGEADEFGDVNRLKEVVPTLNVCDLSQRVK